MRQRSCSVSRPMNSPFLESIEQKALTEGSGVGLQNVRERLEMSAGRSLEIAPRPGGGTVVTLRTPEPCDQT